ncbi:hypothetical protein BDP55DRAFT_632763 [Colletotrichum godetiae]|uniref:Uncharacterized protein n=1 Tax=Colletotrichum godetiae TaxID=1209918 RepID=A0AAJ0EUU5_9PEZI|nr:uncharacterized protein BDP55DRAFT_632763 [Colletotrichum godetiae]KAK1674693.1 hypothetical protein BDP55DRAFT_632763 [Colletotrichum godetiae]
MVMIVLCPLPSDIFVPKPSDEGLRHVSLWRNGECSHGRGLVYSPSSSFQPCSTFWPAEMRHSRRKKQARVKGTSRKKLRSIQRLWCLTRVYSKTEAHASSPSARQHDAHDNDASASDTADSDYASNLDLIQVNLKRFPARMGCLIEHLPHMDPPPDVVAIQDPPPEFGWKSCPGYNIEYLPAREPLEKDNPKTTENPVLVQLVGFHVIQSIDPSEWRIDWREHENKHFSSVASLFLNPPMRSSSLHIRVSVEPNRDKEPRFNWERANEERYCEEVEKQLRTIGFPDIRTLDAVHDYAKALVVAIYQTTHDIDFCQPFVFDKESDYHSQGDDVAGGGSDLSTTATTISVVFRSCEAGALLDQQRHCLTDPSFNTPIFFNLAGARRDSWKPSSVYQGRRKARLQFLDTAVDKQKGVLHQGSEEYRVAQTPF